MTDICFRTGSKIIDMNTMYLYCVPLKINREYGKIHTPGFIIS